MKPLRLLSPLTGLMKTGHSLFRKGLLFLSEHARVEPFSEDTVSPNPITQFQKWFEEARATESPLPNAMIVATTDREGKPGARVMLLKDFDEEGFVFYTNYDSRKAHELDGNPRAAVLFYWPGLIRQVRIEGTTEKVSREESDRYFSTRPRGSQIGAWASHQSGVIAGRGDLEQKFDDYKKQFGGTTIPRPSFWGGYRVRPSRIEFWQGRQDRLHDRIVYDLQPDKRWLIRRLAP